MSLLKDLVQNLVRFVIKHHENMAGSIIPPDNYEHLLPQHLDFYLQNLIQDIVQQSNVDEDHEIIHLLQYVTSVIKVVKPPCSKIHPLNATEQQILFTALKELLTNCYLLSCMSDSKSLTISYLKDNISETFNITGFQNESLDFPQGDTGVLLEELLLKPYRFNSPEDIQEKIIRYLRLDQQKETGPKKSTWKERAQNLEAENTELRDENASLRAKIRLLEQQLADNLSPESTRFDLEHNFLALDLNELRRGESSSQKCDFDKKHPLKNRSHQTNHKKPKSDIREQNYFSSQFSGFFFSGSDCPSSQDEVGFQALSANSQRPSAEEYPQPKPDNTLEEEAFALERTTSFRYYPSDTTTAFHVGSVFKKSTRKTSFERTPLPQSSETDESGHIFK